jgi:voltage-gated potassium channel
MGDLDPLRRSGRPPTSAAPGVIRMITVRPRAQPRAAAPRIERETGSILWDVWMVALALVSIVMIGWAQVHRLAWPDPTFKKLARIDAAIVALCAGELAVLFARSTRKGAFFKQHWADIVGLVPMYAESLALLRVARVLRAVRVVRWLRVVFAGRRTTRSFELVRRVVHESGLRYSCSIFAAVVLVMASAFWFAEHGKNPLIEDFTDAVWWGVSTAATVGYGDVTPATGMGRVLSGVLMLFGLGFVGIVTSSVTAALMIVTNRWGATEEEVIEEQRPTLAAELAALAELHEKGRLDAEEFAAAKRKLISRDGS